MRVLTIVGDLGLGGTQRVAQNLAIGLGNQGVSSAVLAHKKGGARKNILEEHNIRVFHSEDLSESLAQATAWRPDLVHIHRTGYANSAETRLMKHFKREGAKVVETNVFARFDPTEARNLIDVHCLLSRWCRYKWLNWRGRADTSNYVILPNPVDENGFFPLEPSKRIKARDGLGFGSKQVVFGRVGQPLDAKWSPYILEAFATHLSQGFDSRLLLVGAPDSLLKCLSNMASAVRRNVTCLPMIKNDAELREVYSAMDVFLHIAKIGESFGMVLCEAMLCEIPVITLSTPFKDNSQLEVVGHGNGGLVVLQRKSLPNAMQLLALSEGLRTSLGLQARSRVLRNYALPVVLETVRAIYEMCLQSWSNEVRQASLNHLPGNHESFDTFELLEQGLGRLPNAAERLVLNAIHQPLIYRSYSKFRGLRQTGPGWITKVSEKARKK